MVGIVVKKYVCNVVYFFIELKLKKVLIIEIVVKVMIS